MRQPNKLNLANLPTPIHNLERLSEEMGKRIYCWRDDYTGFIESGNKIRKLEFLFAEAREKEATMVITCGGPQSNHVRATVYGARRLGLKSHVVIREPREGMDFQAPTTANHLLDKIAGATFRLVSFKDYHAKGCVYDPFLEEEAEKLRSKGENPYVIPEGGSCPVGVFGYINAAEELKVTWKNKGAGKYPDALFFALGSGGTHAGLHLGFESLGIPTDRVHAVNICDDKDYFTNRVTKLIEDTCERFGIKSKNRSLQIHDGYVGGGYGIASDEDLKFYMELARKEGLLLDPCYTGKAFQGMLSEIKKDPDRFGKNILFLHSGGTFANFAYSEQFEKILRS